MFYSLTKSRCWACVKSFYNTPCGALLLILFLTCIVVQLTGVIIYIMYTINLYLVDNEYLPIPPSTVNRREDTAMLWVGFELVIVCLTYCMIVLLWAGLKDTISKVRKDLDEFDIQMQEVITKKD